MQVGKLKESTVKFKQKYNQIPKIFSQICMSWIHTTDHAHISFLLANKDKS